MESWSVLSAPIIAVGTHSIGRDAAKQQARESSRRDADDRVHASVQRERAADRGRIGVESPRPQALADHHDRVRARRVAFDGIEAAAEDRHDAEQRKVIGGDDLPEDDLASIAVGDRRHQAAVAEHVLECLRHLSRRSRKSG